MFQALFRQLCRKKDPARGLWLEVNANLERYYVYDQRQFFATAFDLKAWEAARCSAGFQVHAEVLEYASAIDNFNRAFADMKAFENFYSLSMDNKIRANAEILHAKKEALAEMAGGLLPRILGARGQIRLMPGNG